MCPDFECALPRNRGNLENILFWREFYLGGGGGGGGYPL